jgi:K+-sensing histidine kinase KdpD
VRDDAAIFAGHLMASFAPLTVAGLMTPLRDTALGVVVVLFALTAVVATAAALGGPVAGAVGTLCAGLSTDFLYVSPYLDLKYRPRGDLWPVVFIVVAGLAITAASWIGWKRKAAAQDEPAPPAVTPSRHIERVARLAEQGADIRDLISAVQAELTTLLIASSCRYEAEDESNLEPASPLRLERDGTVTGRGLDPLLPGEELEIPVRLGGQRLGRFVVQPTPEVIIPLAPRIVAGVLTDHLAAAIARRHPTVRPPT